MITTKTHNYECCMCGDHGLSHQLFRCKVCHFRSQHRYCSNLYPKAESYRVCNWCLIQKEVRDNITTTSNNNSEDHTPTIKKHINNQTGGPKASPKCLQPISPIKKPIRSPEARSPSGRQRITAQAQAQTQKDERLITRRMKSTEEEVILSSNNNNTSGGRNTSGGPLSVKQQQQQPTLIPKSPVPVIKHVFRNKVRRYKLLDEVSS